MTGDSKGHDVKGHLKEGVRKKKETVRERVNEKRRHQGGKGANTSQKRRGRSSRKKKKI